MILIHNLSMTLVITKCCLNIEKKNAREIIVSQISPCDVTDNESALPTGQMKTLKWQPSLHMGLPVKK